MLRLSLVLFGLVATVLAGIGLIVILSVPDWSPRAMTLIPYSVVVAMILSVPVTWFIARRVLIAQHVLGARAEGI